MTTNDQLILPLAVQSDFSRQAWIEDASNQEATAWITQWPDWPWPRLLCVYGEQGSGKTHLAHLWANQAKGLYLKADQACHQSPYEAFRLRQPIVLDNMESLTNQEWLFHFYNFIQDNQSSALLIANSPPSQWPVTLPDLASRLQTVISVQIHRPDELTLRTIMIKQFRDRGLLVKQEAVDYLLKQCERSFSAVNKWVVILDRAAAVKGRSITIPLIREMLSQQGSVL